MCLLRILKAWCELSRQLVVGWKASQGIKKHDNAWDATFLHNLQYAPKIAASLQDMFLCFLFGWSVLVLRINPQYPDESGLVLPLRQSEAAYLLNSNLSNVCFTLFHKAFPSWFDQVSSTYATIRASFSRLSLTSRSKICPWMRSFQERIEKGKIARLQQKHSVLHLGTSCFARIDRSKMCY